MRGRGRLGAKSVDLSALRQLFADGKVWSAVGVVRARNGTNSHFKQEDGDVLVDVDIAPEGTKAWCRLGSSGGGDGIGLWRIPPPDSEVGVILGDGHPGSDPMIACTLSSGGTPDGLDGDVLLIVNSKKVRISSTDEDIEIQAGSGKKVKLGSGGHPLPKWDDFLTKQVTPVLPGTPYSSLAGVLTHILTALTTACANGVPLIAPATPALVNITDFIARIATDEYESQDAENS